MTTSRIVVLAYALLALILAFFPLRGEQSPRVAAQATDSYKLFLPVVAAPAPESIQAADSTLALTKQLVEPADGITQIGAPVSFEITLRNNGSSAIDVLPLYDAFDAATLAFTGATINGQPAPPDLQASGVISWTDLTLLPGLGNLPPGGQLTLRTSFTALAATQPGGGWGSAEFSAQTSDARGLIRRSANDYYDRETRFVIDHAIDPVNGGIYLATKADGTPWGPVPDDVYGFGAGFLDGTSKHPGGHALCVVHFLREYQRLRDTDSTILTERYGVQSAEDMLTWARSCADFANQHLVIGRGGDEPNPLPACTPGDGNTCLYYWGFTDATGTQEHFYAIPASRSVVRYYNLMDSFVAWTNAGLALQLQGLGDPSYVNYKQAAREYWDWAKSVGAPYSPREPSFEDPSYEGRDQLWAGLGMTLYELSVAEGAPEEALRQEVIDCVNQQGAYAESYPMRNRCNGVSYTTAYGRAAAHAMELQHRGVDNFANGRATWHNFGSNHYGSDPATPQNPIQPFTHGAGREFVAGAQRPHWFYYSFPNQPTPDNLLATVEVPGNWTIESWSRAAILGYWDYANTYMWDDTPGQEAWWESQSLQYKPCFSLGTPVPLADWKAPAIGSKVHTLNADGSATVTIGGVADGNWPHLNWEFRGIGVEQVRVRYSSDGGASWQLLTASETVPGSGNYSATIPPAPGQTIFYYAEAEDAFGNVATYPAGAPALYQIYTSQPRTYNLAWSIGARDAGGTAVPPAQDETPLQITEGPTAITLARFDAQRTTTGAQIDWQTGLEQNTYGFYLYRSATPERNDAIRITPTLIAGQGSGSSYSFLDPTPPVGLVYYWLEEIDLEGTRTQHGPVVAEN